MIDPDLSRRWMVGEIGAFAWAYDGHALALGRLAHRSNDNRTPPPGPKQARRAPRAATWTIQASQIVTIVPPRALTPGEVACLARAALTNDEIAHELGVSGSGIKFHFRNLMAKLGAGSRAEALVMGLRRGIVQLDDLALSPASSVRAARLQAARAPVAIPRSRLRARSPRPTVIAV